MMETAIGLLPNIACLLENRGTANINSSWETVKTEPVATLSTEDIGMPL